MAGTGTKMYSSFVKWNLCLFCESWESWEKMQTLCLTGWSVFVFGNQFSSDLILDVSEWVPLQMLFSSPTQSETWSYQRLALWHEFSVNICLTWNQFINIGLMRLRAWHLTRSRFSRTLKSSRRGQESSVAPLRPGPKIGKSLFNTLQEGERNKTFQTPWEEAPLWSRLDSMS